MTRLFGAACVGKTDVMFPRQTRGKAVEMSPAKVAAALAICARCSVTKACANGAIERREMYGIWGGLTPERINRIADDRARMVRASTQQGNRT